MAADGRRHVLAIGGIRLGDDAGRAPGRVPAMLAFAGSLTGKPAPRICVINTASGDDPAAYLRMQDALSTTSWQVSRLALFPMPTVADPEDLLLSADLIFVGGGSVANMVAVWRVHGVDRILHRAWQAGIVLAGVSAGAICWFGGGTTDSFGPDLRPFADGLGMLPGSYCPHYDSESRRAPLFRSLVADGTLPPGIACDDGAAAHVIDDDLAEIVADRPGAGGYLVDRAADGAATQTALPVRQIG